MRYLCDANLMWCQFDNSAPDQAYIRANIDQLVARGNTVYLSPQNLIEFHGLATRPLENNGLGYSPADARVMAREIKTFFPLLPDTSEVYEKWCWLMDNYEVRGRQVHDARLVAVMLANRVSHILTRNGADFRRYREITVVEL